MTDMSSDSGSRGKPTTNQPIFIVGRQHSGNTMMAHILSKHPDVLSMTGEGQFFERRDEVKKQQREDRPETVARLIQESGGDKIDDKARALLTERLGKTDGTYEPEALFVHGMRILVQKAGCEYWAQKATSHIFNVGDIIKVFPKARFVFLSRNPLDIAASFVRRGNRHKLVRMAVGWNRGFRRAEQACEALGKQFHIVGYEDIVRAPDEVPPGLFSQFNLQYEAGVTEVPVVNRAGSGNRREERFGIDASRVFYYEEQLEKWEVASVLRVIDEDLLRRNYPELAERQDSTGKVPGLIDVRLWVAGVGSFVVDHLRRGLQEPRSTLRRVARRVKV